MRKNQPALIAALSIIIAATAASAVYGKAVYEKEEIPEGKICDFGNDSRVINGGRISTYGTLNFLTAEAIELGRQGDGLRCWSPRLLKYTNGKFQAEVYRDGLLSLIRVKNKEGITVDYVRKEELFWVMIRAEKVVGEGGYLFWKEEGEWDKAWNRRIREALRDIENGKKPKLLDNGAYLRVSTDLLGEELIMFWLHTDITKDAHVVFTKDGRRIPFRTTYPFSYAKWAPEDPKAQYSKREK